MASDNDKDYLTVPRAAKEIGVHFATIYRWVEAKTILSVRFGGIVFIPTSEVKRILATKSPERSREGV